MSDELQFVASVLLLKLQRQTEVCRTSDARQFALSAHTQISLVYYFLDQRRQFRWRRVTNFVGRLNSRGRPLTTIRTVTIDDADLIAGAQLVTDLDLGQ